MLQQHKEYVLHLSWSYGRSVGASDSESMESLQFVIIDYKSALCMQSQIVNQEILLPKYFPWYNIR